MEARDERAAQSRMMELRDYVLGLEPANSAVYGRPFHEAEGSLHHLPPFETETNVLRFSVLDGKEELDRARKEVAGILAGTVLAFARALGEYGATSMIAGYTPGRTATISTTVYQLWRTDNDALAFRWVMVNVAISAVVLLVVNLLERRERSGAGMDPGRSAKKKA